VVQVGFGEHPAKYRVQEGQTGTCAQPDLLKFSGL